MNTVRSGVMTREVVEAAGNDTIDLHPLLDRRLPTAVKGHGPLQRAEVRINAGVYAQLKLRPGDWVDIVGENRDRTILAGDNPDSVSLVDIRKSETLHWQGSGRLQDLTVTIRNGRYPLHLDASGKNRNCLQEIDNVVARHLGNDGARAYQRAINGQAAAASVFRSENAIGMGTASGSRYRIRRSELIGQDAGLAIHNNVAFQTGSDVLVEDCLLTSLSDTDEPNAIRVRSLGSGRQDRLVLNRCTLVGELYIGTRPWLVPDLSYQPAVHNEFAISGYGNSPFVTRVKDFGRALRINSRARSGLSRVTVTGSAVPVLFGEVVAADGARGLPGYVRGTVDVSGVPIGLQRKLFITSLGQRLGNCTGSNTKSLVVSVDGGTGVAITFDADYTLATNGAVLNKLNKELGSAAVAFLDNPGERIRPRFSDEEQCLRNKSGVGCRMFQALAYGTNDCSVRPMRSEDHASRFAGIAWEDILPGEFGRVKSRGHLPVADLAYAADAVPSLVAGSTHSIDPAKPGRLMVGGTQGLLPAIRSNAVSVMH